ncbi:putative lipid-transfer protein DIR1 [Ricinus communis]|uniref:Lipid binding protein, putative n=1 Tax=Ricinus communis TaxID=3988 RepID=B9SMN5_RICCO|nr:putative lipid-transfer protein DIR1 [Ricinus communis]EEF35098.1 lipid binding protein, putative [Ricinus communis]|eukprot:XP_002527254.1 putative lipid-transfer protein DIR1 [Ricinus communis]
MEMIMAGKVVLVVVLMVTMFEGSRSLTLCDMNDDGLLACKPSVTKPDPVEPPSPACCQALTGANLTCLCSYRNSLMLPSLGIDPDLALGLPSKCNLTPPADC